MKCLDIHTHCLPMPDEVSVFSCSMEHWPPSESIRYCSPGIHPWYLTEANAEEQYAWLAEAVRYSKTVAVGECGFDKLRGGSPALQQQVFRQCALLAEEVSLPLIIHAVKCTEELIRLKKELHPAVPWIIHGFRGRKEVAQEYLRHGFYLSFGEHFQVEALRITPLDHLFLETDESPLSIGDICRKAASTLNMSAEVLAERINENASTLAICF